MEASRKGNSGILVRCRLGREKPTRSLVRSRGPGPWGWHPSELEFQSQLNQPRRLSRQDIVEGWRTDVAVWQAEIRMVQEIEELRPELEFLTFGNWDVLEGREVPVSISRPLSNIAAGSAELLDRGIRIWRNALKGAGIQPSRGSLRVRCWDSDPKPGSVDSPRTR